MNSGAPRTRTIQDVWFTGNRKLSTRKLADAVGLKAGDTCTQAAIDAATEIVKNGGARDETFAHLTALLPPEEIVDLLFVASFYTGFVRFTASLKLEVEPDYRPFLEKFPMPT